MQLLVELRILGNTINRMQQHALLHAYCKSHSVVWPLDVGGGAVV
jgi:hypothetical protein